MQTSTVFLKIITRYTSLKIKDIYVIVVVLWPHLVSSPTVGELTVTDKQHDVYKITIKDFFYFAAEAEIKNSFHVSGR